MYTSRFYTFCIYVIPNSTSPSPPSTLRYPPTPLDIFWAFNGFMGARCVLRLLFYRGGAQRVTAGRFCVNFGYCVTAAAVKIAAACFWRV